MVPGLKGLSIMGTTDESSTAWQALRHKNITTLSQSFLKHPTLCVIEEYYRTKIIQSHLRFCCLFFIFSFASWHITEGCSLCHWAE